MKKDKSIQVAFILSFFLVQYVLIFTVLNTLKDVVFRSWIIVSGTCVFLIAYLIISFFAIKNYIHEKSQVSINYQDKINDYTEDSLLAAQKLKELQYLINNSRHQEAIDLIDEITSTDSLKTSQSHDSLLKIILSEYETVCKNKGIGWKVSNSINNYGEYMTPKQISSVLGNLLDNAVEAVVKVSNKDDRWISVSLTSKTSITGEEIAEILIENGGQTLAESKCRYIFEPGVTSKKGDEHGYGLAVVKDIVDQLNGSINAVALPETAIEVIVPKF